MKLSMAKKHLAWNAEFCSIDELSDATGTVLAHCEKLENRVKALTLKLQAAKQDIKFLCAG